RHGESRHHDENDVTESAEEVVDANPNLARRLASLDMARDSDAEVQRDDEQRRAAKRALPKPDVGEQHGAHRSDLCEREGSPRLSHRHPHGSYILRRAPELRTR